MNLEQTGERLGPISCGWDDGQTFSELPNPLRDFLFGWRRRSVDIAVCNAQGSNVISWWPLIEDSLPGDIVIFSLAPHRRFPFDSTLDQYESEFNRCLQSVDSDDPEAFIQAVREITHQSIYDESRLYCRTPEILRPLHPDFDDSGEPLSCPGPAYQGVGVLAGKVRPLESVGNEAAQPSDFQGDIGHVILFPRSVRHRELANLTGSQASGDGLAFWKPDRSMRERALDSSPYLATSQDGATFQAADDQRRLNANSSKRILELLPELFSDHPLKSHFETSLKRIRAVAAEYREGRVPTPLQCPQAAFLGDPLRPPSHSDVAPSS